MQPPRLVVENHRDRLRHVLDEAWRIFVSRFVYRRHFILTEAPFQHHFASIIESVGALYCIAPDDLFSVDLETMCEKIKDKRKYFDITCSFVNKKVSCAIELKFKTASQGAQNLGRIDAYCDIEALELACQDRYTFGMFYMITNSKPYVRSSKKGVGTVFAMDHGHTTTRGRFSFPSKGREDKQPNLRGQYTFDWSRSGDWYFLSLPVCPGL